MKISRRCDLNSLRREKAKIWVVYSEGEWGKWDRITVFKWKEEGMICSLHLQQAKQVVVMSCREKDLAEKARKNTGIVRNWARTSVELGSHPPR